MDHLAMKQAMINAQQYEINKWRSIATSLADKLSLTSELSSEQILKECEEGLREVIAFS